MLPSLGNGTKQVELSCTCHFGKPWAASLKLSILLPMTQQFYLWSLRDKNECVQPPTTCTRMSVVEHPSWPNTGNNPSVPRQENGRILVIPWDAALSNLLGTLGTTRRHKSRYTPCLTLGDRGAKPVCSGTPRRLQAQSGALAGRGVGRFSRLSLGVIAGRHDACVDNQ